MNEPLLEVQPRELKFIFELKKQSSCEVRLTNNTYNTVAFKIKTTSPKKYCVRPNVGIVLPNSTCGFTVTMQAPKAAPSEIFCRDKFLIQSTVVPTGTTDQEITPLTFNKVEGKFIEEIKLRVVLTSPPASPVLSPINGVLNQGPLFDPSVPGDQILSKVDKTSKVLPIAKGERDVETKLKKDVIDVHVLKPTKNTVLPDTDLFNGKELNYGKEEKLTQEKDIDDKFAKDVELTLPMNQVKGTEFSLPNKLEDSIFDTTTKDAELSTPDKAVKCAEFVTVNAVKELKLVSDIEEMKSKLNHLEAKLNEAESIISKLTVGRKLSIQERNNLHEGLALLRSRANGKRVQVGFPLLFVVMIALVSTFVGYHCHP